MAGWVSKRGSQKRPGPLSGAGKGSRGSNPNIYVHRVHPDAIYRISLAQASHLTPLGHRKSAGLLRPQAEVVLAGSTLIYRMPSGHSHSARCRRWRRGGCRIKEKKEAALPERTHHSSSGLARAPHFSQHRIQTRIRDAHATLGSSPGAAIGQHFANAPLLPRDKIRRSHDFSTRGTTDRGFNQHNAFTVI